jgi:ribosomal protein L44E
MQDTVGSLQRYNELVLNGYTTHASGARTLCRPAGKRYDLSRNASRLKRGVGTVNKLRPMQVDDCSRLELQLQCVSCLTRSKSKVRRVRVILLTWMFTGVLNIVRSRNQL